MISFRKLRTNWKGKSNVSHFNSVVKILACILGQRVIWRKRLGLSPSRQHSVVFVPRKTLIRLLLSVAECTAFFILLQETNERGPCMLNMKSGMVDGMLVGMLLGAIYGAVQVYRSEEAVNTQKAAVDIADWSVHVAVVCALVGALIALAKGI